MKFFILKAFLLLSTPFVANASSSTKLDLTQLIQQKYGITALDKTDHHSSTVLEALLFLLDNAISPKEFRQMGHFRYLYAYLGHDDRFDIAAFHPEEDAISIGGRSTYSENNRDELIPIVSALAHELGHVFLLKEISATELRVLAVQEGGWPKSYLNRKPADLASSLFFEPHPSQNQIRELSRTGAIPTENWREINMSSAYGSENINEWFAEAFAAFLLNRLGKKGLLGLHWQDKLKTMPRGKAEYWSNYNNLTPQLDNWFARRLQ